MSIEREAIERTIEIAEGLLARASRRVSGLEEKIMDAPDGSARQNAATDEWEIALDEEREARLLLDLLLLKGENA